jgi:four helix bundle protein
MHDFRKLDVWNAAMDLAMAVYELTSRYPKTERFNLVNQIKRSAVSVPSNIAEGAGRNSDGEFKHFLGIALASGNELETQLLLFQRLGLIHEDDTQPILDELHSIQKRIYSLKNRL